MTDFAKTPLQAWNRTGFDEFRVVASDTSKPKTSSIGKVLYNLKAFFGMEPGMLRDLKSENKASVARFKSDINSFFDRRANSEAGKASAYGRIHSLATKQLDYLEQGGRRLSDRSVRQVITHVSTLTDAVDQADENLAKDYSSWVRNEALRQLDMNAILRSAGALDQSGNMNRVLSDQEKSAIQQDVATALRSLCSNRKDNLVLENDAIWNQATSGLHALISDDPRRPIASFGLFGEQAKDQIFFRKPPAKSRREEDFAGEWDQQPLDEGKVKDKVYPGWPVSRTAGDQAAAKTARSSGTIRNCTPSPLSRLPRRCRRPLRETAKTSPRFNGRRPMKRRNGITPCATRSSSNS